MNRLSSHIEGLVEQRPIVYIVDDDPSVRRALIRLIRAVGLDAAASESARDFLASDHARRPACLVLDVRLPGMSGPELQRRLATSEPDLRIVAITAHGDDEIRRQMLEMGAAAFLMKPFDDEVLLEAIDRALRPCPHAAS
jgi:FixJ family two-component response regulator